MKKHFLGWLILVGLLLAMFTTPVLLHCQEDKDGFNGKVVKLIDCKGRLVVLPAKVKRIACLYAFTGHVVTMLGRGEDIIAVSYGLKRDTLLLSICPSILDARVPKAQGSINIEELLVSEPDILFVPGDVAGDLSDMAKLARFQIPYLIIDYSSIETQQYAIKLIGQAIWAEARADEYIDYYQDTIYRVRQLTDKIPMKNRIHVYYAVNEPLRTTLTQSIEIDWLKVTGCENVVLNREQQIIEGANYTSLEQILLWNPDVILANEPSAVQLILNDDKWSALKAVKNRKVYQMPIGISRWGHPGSLETPLAILWTAKTLYPELFSHIDMKAETKAFYKKFFNYELSEEMTEKILSGKNVRKPKRRK
ncbi:MAG: ABC transporter substrate-binding protein [Pseudomonadota bacterium]